jgi:HAD superfamily hydrolase (TIGR01549 family)
MQFFRRLSTIRAFSFDLDDTLYDNGPVIEQAEQSIADYMRSEYLACAMYDRTYWNQLKAELQADDPALKEDVSLCRICMFETGLMRGGMAEADAKTEARRSFQEFLRVRSLVNVPAKSFDLLAEIGRHYPIVGMTNGNVMHDQIGLSPYFRFVIKAGDGLRMKPASDLFAQVARQLDLAPHEIMHVGDDQYTDVYGAIRNGYQAAWLNTTPQRQPALKVLPHLMIYDINELLTLLPTD